MVNLHASIKMNRNRTLPDQIKNLHFNCPFLADRIRVNTANVRETKKEASFMMVMQLLYTLHNMDANPNTRHADRY